MKEITGETIMIAWLKMKYVNDQLFSDREIQLELHSFADRNFPQNNHLPGSWERYFRFVRNKNLLALEELQLCPVEDKRKFDGLKTWEVKKLAVEEPFEMILE